MRIAAKFGRAVVATLAGAMLVLVGAAVLTARGVDPDLFPPHDGDAVVPVRLVDHGYHVGLIVPRARLAALASERGRPALIAVGQRFAAFEWLEIGWGEEVFYRQAPSIGDVTFGMALTSLFGRDNRSVLHVVGFSGDPRRVFGAAATVGLDLSERGFDRTLAGIEASFAVDAGGVPDALGPGLYGPSLFYRSGGRYDILNICNHWVGERLAEAGVPSSRLASTLPPTLFLELRWRAGAR